MKILYLRFKNLNSLRGEWQIDFRHPSYQDNGIFAITGKTGAGKSTILDAICLALYGETPRLGELSRTNNDLMSRQTGECLSEVIFATQDGEFICHWSQRRARGKADGALQQPNHELAEHGANGKGKVIDSQTRKVKSAIVELTGLDFERFTRSMLLAQGGFAKFLQASADQRSPLLERITGTAIYADISIKVHEIKREHEQAVTRLKEHLQGLQLLDANELATLNEQETTLNQQLSQIQQTIQHLQAAEKRQTQLDNLRDNLHEYQTELADIQSQITEFAPNQHKLNRAKQALELAGDYRALQLAREQAHNIQHEHATFSAQYPTRQAAVHHAQTQTEVCLTAYHQHEQAWHEAQPLLNHVREQDATLRQLLSQQTEYERSQAEFNTRLNHLNESLRQTQADHFRISQTELTLTKRLAEPIWQELPQTLARLESLAKALTDVETRHDKAQTQQTLISNKVHDNTHQQKLLSENIDRLNSDLATQQTMLANAQQTLADLLAGNSRHDWQQRYNQLGQLEQTLQRLGEVQTQAQTNVVAHQQLSAELGVLEQTLATLDSDIATQSRAHQLADERVKLLNANLKLLYKIADLESERAHLIDGKPCPLCGATKHPYASDQPATPNQTEQQLLLAQTELNTLGQKLEQLRLTQARTQQNHQQAQTRLAETTQAHQVIAAKLTELDSKIQQLDKAKHYPNLTDAAHTSAAVQNVQRTLSELHNRLNHIDESEHTLSQAQADYQSLQQAMQAAANESHLLRHQHDTLQAQLADTHSNLIELTQQLTDVQAEIFSLLTPYQAFLTPPLGMGNYLTRHSLADTREAMNHLYTQIQTEQAELADSQQRKRALEQTLTRLTTEQAHVQANLAQAQNTRLALQHDIDQRRAARHAAFGDNHPDDHAAMLNAQRQTALDTWHTAKQTQTDAEHALRQLQAHLSRLETQILQYQQRTHTANAAFAQRLAQLGFADEADYQTAVLLETERAALQQTADNLTQNLVQTQTKLHETQEDLALTQQSTVAPELAALSADELRKQLQHTNAEQQALSEQRGSVRQQLAQQQQQQDQQRAIGANLATAQTELDNWALLHQLIGSSDGKKFRNFAQNLTLSIVVSHANRQLAKMSDRYLLIADPNEPLMLNVIDNYQGGEQRTSKNLSGGESFIISLALALGLSHLVSERMRVDSLFLDEGFGTLDEDALDIALDTLTNLHETGKLIGVISHVGALKDRIVNQIQVIPTSGGVSNLIGNGVQRLA